MVGKRAYAKLKTQSLHPAMQQLALALDLLKVIFCYCTSKRENCTERHDCCTVKKKVEGCTEVQAKILVQCGGKNSRGTEQELLWRNSPHL